MVFSTMSCVPLCLNLAVAISHSQSFLVASIVAAVPGVETGEERQTMEKAPWSLTVIYVISVYGMRISGRAGGSATRGLAILERG